MSSNERFGFKRFFLSFLCLICWGLTPVQAQLFALKNNVLADAACAPNLSMELVTGNKTSLSGTILGTWNIYGMDAKMLGIMPEYRYWFNGRPLTREFIGISAAAVTYDISTSTQRYIGDAFGAGITFGYDFLLSPHWSLDCHAGFGLLYYDQQRYYLGDLIRNNYYNANGFLLIPYNIGVTFAWIIK